MADYLRTNHFARIRMSGMSGSQISLFAAALNQAADHTQLLIVPDRDTAAYLYNDLENLLGNVNEEFVLRKVLFFPTSYQKSYDVENTSNNNVLVRSDVINKLGRKKRLVIVTYPEALCEKIVNHAFIEKNTLHLKTGEQVTHDFIIDVLMEYEFERVEFVAEPGQFAVRGGLIDVFSFDHDYPYRIEFEGDMVESLRTFHPASQLSVKELQHISILPNIQNRKEKESRSSLINQLPQDSVIWVTDLGLSVEKLHAEFEKISEFLEVHSEKIVFTPGELFLDSKEFRRELLNRRIIEFGQRPVLDFGLELNFQSLPQPSFNKNFDMLIGHLVEYTDQGMTNVIFSGSSKQSERLEAIFSDISGRKNLDQAFDFHTIPLSLHEGFISYDLKLACFTDHQIFNRYHQYHLREGFSGKESLTLRELYNLKPGDFVTHIDHGIGRFEGLEVIENNGRQQEALRLTYRNGDLVYVSIHSLHRIARYVGKDGTEPVLDKLGSSAWTNLKNKTKRKVKDIARELIQLYAKRRASQGIRYSPDNYLQTELEASFMYEDTPDQIKATSDVKADMEKEFPMDRLVCGDVGFGKTEVAIRAAFKAVNDSKQVAVLVPTTILALQHYKTFRERLHEFPCNVDYINRFKSSEKIKQTLVNLKAGKTDILIGTHRLLSKDIEFKDLGLLIIDEEQKFGVAAKEKLKQLRVNVDTLTLTATPIPRTLQFSMMGARDLSVINTPPPNRIPIHTELRTFSEEVIRDAIDYELGRGGQVFFVHNRVQNINDVADMIKKFCPDARIGIGHGQMDGAKLENVMLDFIEGEYDVLVATTIIENGLDIPNANTIIINDAQHYGLSDLHQLRGRVGRANKKAFCYLITPPLITLSDEARKRLKAIEEFTNLGSGFNIALRDLDIRGAGDILGAEQSGFISEIGYEMYQKILDEAVLELKNEEFPELNEPVPESGWISDSVIETDLEIHIPPDYISNTAERLSIYKDIDSLKDDQELEKCRSMLNDRFGKIPKPVEELFEVVKLRWICNHLGFEKALLKNGRMFCFFISHPNSPYFQSQVFMNVIEFVKQNPRNFLMRQNHDRLSLMINHVDSISKAIKQLQPIRRFATLQPETS